MHRVLTLPNLITVVRIGLVPVFLVLERTGHYQAGLVVFLAAAFSDLLDGLLARLLNQFSRLGAMLDPVADKLLLTTALLTLWLDHRMPLWLLVVVCLREAMFAVGAAIVGYRGVQLPTPRPTRIGKYATFTLVCVVFLTLVNTTGRLPRELAAYIPVVGFIAGLCVAISTLQYFSRFGYLFFVHPRSGPSVKPHKTARQT